MCLCLHALVGGPLLESSIVFVLPELLTIRGPLFQRQYASSDPYRTSAGMRSKFSSWREVNLV